MLSTIYHLLHKYRYITLLCMALLFALIARLPVTFILAQTTHAHSKQVAVTHSVTRSGRKQSQPKKTAPLPGKTATAQSTSSPEQPVTPQPTSPTSSPQQSTTSQVTSSSQTKPGPPPVSQKSNPPSNPPSKPVPTTPPVPPPAPKPAPTAPPPPAPHWQAVLQQFGPDCGNPAGTVWNVPHPESTSVVCSGSGTLVTQTTSTRFGELDLNQVNGSAYDQNTFRLIIQEKFTNTGDTATAAAIILRTPQSGCGGLIFTLNAAGYWQLQSIATCVNIPTILSGTIGINPGLPTNIVVVAQYNALSVYINGSAVISSYPYTSIATLSEVGLMIERPGGTSSAVQYSNFELDLWQ